MTKTNKKRTVFALSVLLVLVMAVTGIALAQNANITLSSDLSDSYYRNYKLEVPEANLAIGADDYTMDYVVTYPDGRTSSDAQVTLDVVGDYTVTYTKEVNSVPYEKVYDFYVNESLASYFTYGDNVYCEGEMEVPDYVDRSLYTDTLKGAKYTFTEEGATIRYDGIIDLYELGFKKEHITGHWDTPKPGEFIEFMITPDDNSVKEFNMLEIKLIDVHNPDNFILFDCWSADKTFSQNGVFIGMTSNAMFDSMGYDNLSISPNGANSGTSFYGQFGANRAFPCRLYLDPDSFVSAVYPKSVVHATLTLFDKMNDSAIVGYGNEWFGFTTGEVYLELTAKELLRPECSITIMSVGGHRLGTSLDEKTTISVLTGDLDGDGNYNDVDSLPYAVASPTSVYPVFDAVAYSTNGGVLSNLKTSVYYDNGGVFENVIIDGKTFKTDRAGDYYIEYSINSTYGTAKKTIQVECLPGYEAGDDPDYLLSSETTQLTVAGLGDIVRVYNGACVGGQGIWSVDTKLEYRVGSSAGWDELDIQGSSVKYFKADAPGEYRLTYTAVDMLGTEIVKTHTVSVDYDNAPRLSSPNVPTSVIKGRSINFPKATAQFINESGKQDVKVEVFVDGIDYTNDKYTVNGDFTVVYKATLVSDSSKFVEKSFNVKAIDVEDIEDEDEQIVAYLEEHFISSDMDVSVNDNDRIELSVQSAQDSSFTLVDYLLYNTFAINYDLKATTHGVAKVSINLQDIESSEYLLINLINNGGKTIVSTNKSVDGKMYNKAGEEIDANGVEGFVGKASVTLKATKLGSSEITKNYVVVTVNNTEIYVEIQKLQIANVNMSVGFIGVTDAETAFEIIKLNGAEFEKNGYPAQQFLGKYFDISDADEDSKKDFELRAEKNSLAFITDTDMASFTFINAIPVELFDVIINVSQELKANRFGAINVYLTDSVNADEVVKLSIVKIVVEDKGLCFAQFYLNDEMITGITGSFNGTSTSPFQLTYNKRERAVYDAMGLELSKIDTFLSGEAFNGFTSGKVYLKIELEGVTGLTDIKVSRIANQPLNYTMSEDGTAPQIIFSRSVSTSVYSALGIPHTVASAIAYDALSEVGSVKVLITGPGGSADKIYDGDIDKDYTFTPNKIGRYTMRYSVTDTAGNRMPQKSFFLFVQEEVEPTVTVANGPKSVYNVGDKYKIGAVTVSDDTDDECVVTIFVESPTMRQTSVSVDQEITFEKPGVYTLFYYVRDKYYNRSVVSYSILVVEKEA